MAKRRRGRRTKAERGTAEKERVVREMIRKLDRRYGGAEWDGQRTRRDPLEDTMRTILSQNTTDANRDRAFRAMRARYPTWTRVMQADERELKETIAVAGLANSKGPAMQSFLRWLKEATGKLDLGFLRDLSPEEGIELLVQHRGVGLKTAYIVLSFSCGKDLCAVDTHVHRILKRVGLIDEACGREKAHAVLRPLIPRGKARMYHINMIDFGKDLCTARNPGCEACPIQSLCLYYAREQGS